MKDLILVVIAPVALVFVFMSGPGSSAEIFPVFALILVAAIIVKIITWALSFDERK